MKTLKAKPIWKRNWYVEKEAWKLWWECTKTWASFTWAMLFGER